MLLDIGLLKRKSKQKQKQKQNKSQKKKKHSKLSKVWAIPIPIPTTKDVISCSNAYIYHFLDYITLLLSVNANVILSFIMSKNVEHSSEKTPRELMERFTNLTHL